MVCLPFCLTESFTRVFCDEVSNRKGQGMHRQLSPEHAAHVPQHSDSEQERVRFVYENPSTDYGWHYFFGVRESFARSFNRLVPVEQWAVERGAPGSLVEVVSSFLDRTNQFREKLAGGMCVYWIVVRITVPRPDGEATLMPAMVCSVFTPTRTLACAFDSVLREPDKDEMDQLTLSVTNLARVLPVAVGTKHECARAQLYLDTVHEGLMTGYELAFPDSVDKRFRAKPN